MANWVMPAVLGGLGLLGAGSSAMSSLMSYNYAKKLQNHQYELNEKAQRNYWQNARYSVTNAGYNPLLALGSGTQGFSASSSGVPVDLSSGISQGVNSALSIAQNKATINNINADSALKGAQVDTEKARQIQINFQNAMTDVETHLKRKDLSTYDRKFYSNLYEQMQRAENYKAQSAIGQMNAQTNRINAETQKYNNPFNWAHSAMSQHAKSFEKDHPYLSRTKHWQSIKNYIGE